MLARGQVARQPRQAGKRFWVGAGKNGGMSRWYAPFGGRLDLGLYSDRQAEKRGGICAAPIKIRMF
ncbi:MAG: hypothetical protein ACJA1J_001562 [Sulfitobacter pontiacus]|jgi:hypothetical protein